MDARERNRRAARRAVLVCSYLILMLLAVALYNNGFPTPGIVLSIAASSALWQSLLFYSQRGDL